MSSTISIIIPVYNAENFIGRCLDALINQTYPNIEILCINDGSADNSLKILQEYAAKDKRIKVFSQSNSGPAQARNVGLQNMTGEYLMFCDSDDWYEPQMCERMLETIINKKVDFVACNSNILAQEEKHGRTQKDIEYNTMTLSGKFSLDLHQKAATNVLLWNKIFKTQKIREYGLSFPAGYEHDDMSFIHQYLAVSQNFYALPERLYNYVLRENSLMGKLFNGKSHSKIFDPLFSTQYTINFLERTNLLNENADFMQHCICMDLHTVWSMQPTKEEQQKAAELAAENALRCGKPNITIISWLQQKKYDEVIRKMNGEREVKNFLFLKREKYALGRTKYRNYYFLNWKFAQKIKEPDDTVNFYLFGKKRHTKKLT